MVQLLELPREIFELIIKHAVASDNALAVSRRPLGPLAQQTAALRSALAYRLVHSRFQRAADPFIFRNVEARLGSTTLEKTSSINKIISTPRLARHVAGLRIGIQEEEDSLEGKLAQAFEKLLRQFAGQLVALTVKPLSPPLRYVFRSGKIGSAFAKLQDLNFMDPTSVLYLPEVLASAPALSRVNFGLLYKAGPNGSDGLIHMIETYWPADYAPTHPLKLLSVYGWVVRNGNCLRWRNCKPRAWKSTYSTRIHQERWRRMSQH